MELRLVASGKLKIVSQVAQDAESNAIPTDGFFTSASGLGALGVASSCHDPSQASLPSTPYAPALISCCSTAFLTATTPRPGASSTKAQVVDPAYILAHAQQATRQAGTAAVTLAALQPGGKLCVSNLGNCRVMVLRNGEIWDQTDDQLHSEVWGVRKPYQIGHPAFAHGADSIHDAQRYLWDVNERDIVISGTETFFNNIKSHEILTLTSQVLADCGAPQNPSPTSGLKRVASALRRHTSGSGALKTETRESPGGAAATAAASSGNGSSAGSSRVPSPDPHGDPVVVAAARAADLLASVAAKRLAKRKAAAAAAANTAALAAADTNSGGKGSIFARLVKQPKSAAPQQQGLSDLKDVVACVVAIVCSAGSGSEAAVSSECSTMPTQQVPAPVDLDAATAGAAPTVGVVTNLQPESSGSSISDGTDYQYPENPSALPAPEEFKHYRGLQTDLSGDLPANGRAAAASDDSSNVSHSSSVGGAASEVESTSKLLKASSMKGPGFGRAQIRCEAGSDRIRAYQAGAADQAGWIHNNLIKVGWMTPELGESPTKLKLEARRSASARLLSVAAIEAKSVGARVSRSGSQSQLLHMQSMQGAYMNPMYYGNPMSEFSGITDYQTQQQQQSRRSTLGGSGSRSRNANRSEGGVISCSRSSSNLTALMGLPPTPASVISKGSSVARPPTPPLPTAAAAVDPATAEPAGMDCQGQQLYVGCRVVVETAAGVAAVGTVKLVTGKQLNKWEPEKVSPGHVGVGDIRIDPTMEPAARQTRFWVKNEAFQLYGNHPDYTFWTKKSTLEKGINVSIPCSTLRLVG